VVLGLFESDGAGASVILYDSSKYVLSVLQKIRDAYGKGKNLILDARKSRNEIQAHINLENGRTYDLILMYENTDKIDSPILFKQQDYQPATQFSTEGIALYSDDIAPSKGNLVLSILFNNQNRDVTDDINTLSNYLFRRTKEGNNLTLFVSGFNLPFHKDMIVCAAEGFVTKKIAGAMFPLFGWADLISNAADATYSMVNNKYFIEDLKETLISGKCQEADKFTSNITVSQTDVEDYWGDMDDRFMFATNNAERVYAKGDNSIQTALDASGFAKRMSDGRKAAKDMIAKIKNGTIKLLPGAVIDVVCHSMGFAYAQGMIEELFTGGYKIGWVYAIAPENPSQGYVPNQIEGIWQYGSQETDDFNKQDGIAPQVAIPGIKDEQRVPIDPSAPQNFLQSHVIANYKWIFYRTEKQGGYVKARK